MTADADNAGRSDPNSAPMDAEDYPDTAAGTSHGAGDAETELVPPATVADPAHAWSREDPVTEALSRPWRSVWAIAGIGLLCAVIAAFAIFGVVALVRENHGATQTSPSTPPTATPPAVVPGTNSAPAGPPPQGRPVDPASTGPAEGSSCSHAQHNNVTISNGGTIVRCVSGPAGYWWQPDTGQQAEPALVGQQGWAACLKSSPQAQCVMSAVAVAGGINPAGPVYPPGAYAVPAAMPYGTYGASIDFGTGQFSNGIAANPCTYATYDVAGNVINTGTFNSQAPPQAEIDRNTTLFLTSGCTPWALTKTNWDMGTTQTTPRLSLPGTDAQGFLESNARCHPGNPPALMAQTTKSLVVVCQAGAGNYYYRGVRLSDGASIELSNAVHTSSGFEVTNPADGTRYQVRPNGLNIISAGGQVDSEPMVHYAPS